MRVIEICIANLTILLFMKFKQLTGWFQYLIIRQFHFRIQGQKTQLTGLFARIIYSPVLFSNTRSNKKVQFFNNFITKTLFQSY